jgi:hypothetical protein
VIKRITNGFYPASLLMALAVLSVIAVPQDARATSSGSVAWKVSLVAQPTNFVSTGGSSGESVDQYVILLTNIGKLESRGPITLTDTLPAGVTVGNPAGGPGWGCPTSRGGAVVTCTYTAGVSSLGQSAVLTIPVAVAAQGRLTDGVVVSGGGAPVVTAEVSTVVGERPPSFGFLDFAFQPSTPSGALDTQAGGHPYALTTTFDFPQREVAERLGEPEKPVQTPKSIELELPAGFVGNPQATPRCTIIEVFSLSCKPNTRVGTFFINFAQGLFNEEQNAFPIYNVIPEHGYPAEFGFFAKGVNRPVFLYGSVGPPPAYRLRVSAPDVVFSAGASNLIVTFFGDPPTMDGETNLSTAFLTNPSDCSGGSLAANITVHTWEEPANPVSTEGQTAPVAGCDLLQFEPSFSLAPEATQANQHPGTAFAGEPAGYAFDMKFPQAPPDPESLATPPVKNITVTLPAGLTLNPSAAEGLAVCPSEGPEGINLSTPGTGHCPLASQVGTAEATTPLLTEPLQGHAYVAAPGCGDEEEPCGPADALDGNLYGLYLQLEGSGVVIKLHGTVSANPTNGQLTATFEGIPQQPVSDVKLTLKGGQRAPLANPQSCGEALSSADMTPWSSPETPDVHPSFAFSVIGCEGASFSPSFMAGTTQTAGGSYTEFSTTLGRADRMQDLAAVQVQTPPGLLGMLSHVSLCQEPQAAQGTCSSAAEIGTATAGAGAGSEPFWVTGKVYVTGPYKGAPYGLSIVLPAKAGPFNLGTVVTRAAITVNPKTAALTVTSDPLPQIIDGIPLRVQTVNVTINRPQFIFNPTNCSAQQITGTIASAQGAAAQVSSPFAAGGCKNLPFNPGFTVATRKPAAKLDGAELVVKVSSPQGQAHIHSIEFAFPKQLPARLKTLQQACLDTTFNVNPAACPSVSLIGVAKAVTPVLSIPLVGPVYLVSHGGAAFPDVDMVLQAEGVRVEVTGNINVSRHGITSVDVANAPDAPFSSFEVQTPEGLHSALSTDGSLCAKTLTMPTTIIGQNERRLVRTTRVVVASCGKPKKLARKSSIDTAKGRPSQRFHTNTGSGR